MSENLRKLNNIAVYRHLRKIAAGTFDRNFLALGFAAIVTCLGLGIILIGGSLLKYFEMHLIQAVFLLSISGIAAYAVLIWLTKVKISALIAFHLSIGLLIINAASSIINLWKYFNHQLADRWSEQVIALPAMLVDHIVDLYSMSNLSQPPFINSYYPPVYYLTLKLLFLLVRDPVLGGRYISVASICIIAVLLGLTLRKNHEKFWSVAPPLLFLSIVPTLVLNNGSLVKPEFLATCFSFGGLVVFLDRGLAEGKRWVLASALLCALALLTKPTGFVGFMTIAVYLLSCRRFSELARFVVLVVGVFVLTYAVFWIPGDGGIWLMTISGNVQYTSQKILDLGVNFYLSNVFVMLAIVASTFLLLTGRGPQRIAALYFLIGFAWFMVSIGNPGSSYSYFVEAATGGALVIGMLICQYAVQKRWNSLRVVSIAIAIAMVAQWRPQYLVLTYTEDYAEDQRRIIQQLTQLKTRPDEFIAADVAYTYDVIQAGHKPLIIDSYAYTASSDSNYISAGPILKVLQSKRVPYLVLQNTLDWHSSLPYGARYWPQDVLVYMKQNYMCTTVLQRNDRRYLVICELPAKIGSSRMSAIAKFDEIN